VTGQPLDSEKAVGALLARVETNGAEVLGELSRQELAALDALEGAVLDGSALSWWAGLDEAEQAEVREAAGQSLSERGLVHVMAGDDGERSAQMAPELGIMLLARRSPSVVAVAAARDREPTNATDKDGINGATVAVERHGDRAAACNLSAGAKVEERYVLYGVAEEERGLRWVLVERVEASGLHRFLMATPAWATRELAQWACTSPGPDTSSADGYEAIPAPVTRVIEVIHPHPDGPKRAGLIVQVGSGKPRSSAGVPSAEDERSRVVFAATKPEELMTRLTAMLTDTPQHPWDIA